MIQKLVKKIFGTRSDREIKQLYPIVDNINQLADLSNIEIFYFSCLAFLTMLLGIYPKLLFEMINKSISMSIL